MHSRGRGTSPGNWRTAVRPKLLRAPLSMRYRVAYRRCRNVYGMELPYTVELGRRGVVAHQDCMVIHGWRKIGDDCIIRQNCTLGIRSLDRLQDAPVLGVRVNVGAGAVLLGAIAVGEGAQIGANAVVLQDVSANTLAFGVPARIVARS